MSTNVVLLALAFLLFSVKCLHLTNHFQDNQNNCSFFSIGRTGDSSLQYEIIKQWTQDEVAQLKDGSKNISDYIKITNDDGNQTNHFFNYTINQNFTGFFKPQINANKSDVASFNITENQLLYIVPKKARLYKVPEGKVLTGIRFQIKEGTVGKWSVLFKKFTKTSFQKHKQTLIANFTKKFMVNQQSSVIANALKIDYTKIAKDLLDTFSQPPLEGLKNAINFYAYLIVIPEGEKFVAAPINKGLQNLLVMKDKLMDRQPCG